MSEHAETPYRCTFGRDSSLWCLSYRICCGTSQDEYATAKCKQQHCEEHRPLDLSEILEPLVGPKTAHPYAGTITNAQTTYGFSGDPRVFVCSYCLALILGEVLSEHIDRCHPGGRFA